MTDNEEDEQLGEFDSNDASVGGSDEVRREVVPFDEHHVAVLCVQQSIFHINYPLRNQLAIEPARNDEARCCVLLQALRKWFVLIGHNSCTISSIDSREEVKLCVDQVRMPRNDVDWSEHRVDEVGRNWQANALVEAEHGL